MDRRNFIATSLLGIGGTTLMGYKYPLNQVIEKTSFAVRDKKLIATTDFYDNIVINHKGSRYGEPVIRNEEYYRKHKCYMDRSQLDGLHKFLSSIGVTRHQWIVDTIWTLYEEYPQGFDLLEEAAKSAHKYNIEFIALIKPFEGGGFGNILPHSMPFPKGAVAIKDMRGIMPVARKFVAEHPSLSLKCKTGINECDQSVTTIRLVKGDEKPTRLKADHLSLWTSSSNNKFVPYEGPLVFRETTEKRFRFPYWRECRVLHLEKLNIPEGHRYFLIRSSLADVRGDFSNEKGNIIELVGKDGTILPHSLSTGQVLLEDHYESFYCSKIMGQLVRYLQLPEVQAEISDLVKMKEHYRDFYSFDKYNLGDWITLDKEGFVAAACGIPEYMSGNLHPLYPEVRKHWLELVKFCLDRGADGINFRVGNHTNIPQYWNYGFNKPVLEAAEGKTDDSTINRINGEAYTLFLREAQKLIQSRDKKIIMHLHSDMLMKDERPGKLNGLPPNFEWQWETWVKEIADELEFRGVYKLRPHNLVKVISIFGEVAKQANKPFYFQGDFHGKSFVRPFYSTDAELEMVKKSDYLDGYVLYETANFTRINDQDKVEGSPELLKVLKKQGIIKQE